MTAAFVRFPPASSIAFFTIPRSGRMTPILQNHTTTVKAAALTFKPHVVETRAMTKRTARVGRGGAKGSFPSTSMRLDPALLLRAEELKLQERREGRRITTSEILNAALADYLKRHGA